MEIILDNIAIWKAKLSEGLTVRTTPAGARIQKAGTNILAQADKTIYRYAKNYKTKGRGGVSFCLFVRTYSDDRDAIEKMLDDYAGTLKATDVAAAIAGADERHFTYTNTYLEEK